MKIICYLIGIIDSLKTMKIVSGHNYIEKYKNKDVQILECDRCGHVSVGYFN